MHNGLVGVVDCICGASDLLLSGVDNLRIVVHECALEEAHIIHRDVSPFNLLFVAATQSNLGVNFLGRVLQETEKVKIEAKIQALSRRGLLGDWGYAVPIQDPSCKDLRIPVNTPGICVKHDSETVVRSQSDLRNTDNIVIPVIDEPLPGDAGLSTDTNPLHRTVRGKVVFIYSFCSYGLGYLGMDGRGAQCRETRNTGRPSSSP